MTQGKLFSSNLEIPGYYKGYNSQQQTAVNAIIVR